eukprot:4644786-Amphidinium_carterae.2
MSTYVSEHLGLPDQATVVTRGYYSQRASLRFTDEDAASAYLKAFREAAYTHMGEKLYIQRDLAPEQR